jgi:peroxiredoxin
MWTEKKDFALATIDNVNIIRTGFYAIDFTLTDTQGNVFHLNENLDGHFTALVFFADGESEKIGGYLKTLSQGLPNTAAGLPVRVIAIGPEKVSYLKNLKDKLKLNYSVLADPQLSVAAKYSVVNSQCAKFSVHFSIFIVDDMGVIRHRASEVTGFSRFFLEELKTAISRLI